MTEINDDQTLVKQFEAAVEGLDFVSESDAPFQVALWDEPGLSTLTPTAIAHKTAHAPNTPTDEMSVEDFFSIAIQEQDWFGDEERAIAQRYRDLVNLIKTNLTDVQIYRLGEASKDVYVAGKTTENHWLVLSTQVVET